MLPPLCTGFCTPTAAGHSVLRSLPLATMCKRGQLEIRGGKRHLWIFPQIRNPFPPPDAYHSQCYSSELALPLLNCLPCRNRGEIRYQHLSGSPSWAWILDVHHLSVDICSPGSICSIGQQCVYGHPTQTPLPNGAGNGA